jgi:hypothetical protein
MTKGNQYDSFHVQLFGSCLETYAEQSCRHSGKIGRARRSRQIQIATDQAKWCAARFGGIDIPRFEDDETSFDELQMRIAKTIAFLDSFKEHQIDGSEERDIVLQIHETRLEFKGQDYLHNWVLPNFYFHATTAYNILRHNGVDIGKKISWGLDGGWRIGKRCLAPGH